MSPLGWNVSGEISLLAADGDVMDTKSFSEFNELHEAVDVLIEDWTDIKADFGVTEYDDFVAHLARLVVDDYKDPDSAGSEILDVNNRLHLVVDFV